MRKLSTRDKLLTKSIPITECGCWAWLGCLSDGGYGKIEIDGKTVRAHRLAFELFSGPIGQGKFVCHRCDNRWCVNHDHLFLGTHEDNMRDMRLKDRHAARERSGRTKFSRELVMRAVKMVRAGHSLRAAARETGISNQQISQVMNGKSWVGVLSQPAAE